MQAGRRRRTRSRLRADRNAPLWHNSLPPASPAPTRSLRIIRRMSIPPPTAPASGRPHVLIVGCGFGGLEAARKLQKADVDITIVDKTNHHLFQPLLYQVA